MHIKLKNKKLLFNDYKIKCAIGKRGISIKKREGDNCTPKGTFKLLRVYYRGDKNKKIKTTLRKTVIKKNMGWCDDPSSKKYNKLIHYPFKFRSEKLYRKDNIYDIIIVINYNHRPVKKFKGSAIFLHIAKKNYKPTKGCIAIKKEHMLLLLKLIKKRSRLIIF